MLNRVLSSIVYLAIFLLAIFFGIRYPLVMDILLSVIFIISFYEMYKAYHKNYNKTCNILLIVYGVTMLLSNYLIRYLDFTMALYVCLVFLFSILGFIIYIKQFINFDSFKDYLLAIVYPTIPLISLFMINSFDKGSIIIFYIFAVSALTDTFAFFGGKIIGGRKLCKISPNKTISGAISGLVGGILGSILVYVLLHSAGFMSFFDPTFYQLSSGLEEMIMMTSIWYFILLGLASSVVNQVGDLFASSIKREANLKDFGYILPGHGGILDRIDGLMFVSVLVLIIIYL